jgi:dipeptidyl-peptidase-4
MNKISLLVLSCFMATLSFAQNKKITLEDGVLQQNRTFRADKLLGFQWIPNTNKHVYFADSGRKLMTATTSNATATELVTLADLNQSLAPTSNRFSASNSRTPAR